MLHHVSFNAREPKRVAQALAQLITARTIGAPCPPFPKDSWFVCLGDEFGTLIEVMPWGETRDASTPTGVGHDPQMRQSSGSHILIATPRSSEEVLEIGAQLGWRAELASAGLFRFVKVWVENSFLVELLPPEFRDEYVNAFGRAGIHKLEWQLRDIERGIRAQVG